MTVALFDVLPAHFFVFVPLLGITITDRDFHGASTSSHFVVK